MEFRAAVLVTSFALLAPHSSLSCCGAPPPPPPAAPMVTISCTNCATFAALQNAALSYYQTNFRKSPPGWPNTPTYIVGTGTRALVVSTNLPLTANFIFSTGSTGGLSVVPVTAKNETDAYALDQRAIARSMQPIRLADPALSLQSVDEVVIDAVQRIIPEVGVPGVDIPKSIANLSKSVYSTFVNLQ